jgi:elongation factor Ts
MEITASMVKELRERSGAGMMECKKALTENGGNLETAIEWLRKQGLAKADKKASRIAAEGRIVLAQSSENEAGGRAVLVEVNSETDFVAKDESFVAFANMVAKQALTSGANDIAALKQAKAPNGGSIEETRQALVAKVGENVQIRRLVRVDGAHRVGAYVHGGRIGVLVEMKGGSDELARGIAMHIAAMNPSYISPDHVPADIIAKEKEIALAQIKDSGKPPEILEKMITGKLRKTLSEMSLTGQPYVLDTNVTVEAALKKEGAEVLALHRIAVGEGIEKPVGDDFATEVMKQAGLA